MTFVLLPFYDSLYNIVVAPKSLEGAFYMELATMFQNKVDTVAWHGCFNSRGQIDVPGKQLLSRLQRIIEDYF